jgi:hypothetical protein
MNFLPPVSKSLRRDFQQNGYAAISNALPLDVIERWRQEAEHLKANALTIHRSDGSFELVYRVVTGEVIRNQWPELFAFYSDPRVLQWIKDLTGEQTICTSSALRSAVNLNIMDNADSVYRWHFDAMPYTMLIYLNDVAVRDGGAMQMVPRCELHRVPDLAKSHIVELWPTAGTLVFMDGTRCYHRVSRLLRPTTRFSVPLVYPNTERIQRPSGLDGYLYKESA